MNRVYILLGGNLGDREKILSQSREMIRKEIGNITCMSSIFETQAWGFKTDQSFLNQVISVDTENSAEDSLKQLLYIEKTLGRKRTSKNYESRVIDLDILFYNNAVINLEQLQVPHPRLHLRMFTLIPLNEIAPKMMHPIYNTRISTLMKKCTDTSIVKIFKPMS